MHLNIFPIFIIHFYLISSSTLSTLLHLTNNYRQHYSLPSLNIHPTLNVSADILVKYMCKSKILTHNHPFYKNLQDRLNFLNFTYISIGENIARASVNSKIEEIFKVWTQSAEHRKNILGNYNFAGTSMCVADNGQRYVVMVFAKKKVKNRKWIKRCLNHMRDEIFDMINKKSDESSESSESSDVRKNRFINDDQNNVKLYDKYSGNEYKENFDRYDDEEDKKIYVSEIFNKNRNVGSEEELGNGDKNQSNVDMNNGGNNISIDKNLDKINSSPIDKYLEKIDSYPEENKNYTDKVNIESKENIIQNNKNSPEDKKNASSIIDKYLEKIDKYPIKMNINENTSNPTKYLDDAHSNPEVMNANKDNSFAKNHDDHPFTKNYDDHPFTKNYDEKPNNNNYDDNPFTNNYDNNPVTNNYDKFSSVTQDNNIASTDRNFDTNTKIETITITQTITEPLSILPIQNTPTKDQQTENYNSMNKPQMQGTTFSQSLLNASISKFPLTNNSNSTLIQSEPINNESYLSKLNDYFLEPEIRSLIDKYSVKIKEVKEKEKEKSISPAIYLNIDDDTVLVSNNHNKLLNYNDKNADMKLNVNDNLDKLNNNAKIRQPTIMKNITDIQISNNIDTKITQSTKIHNSHNSYNSNNTHNLQNSSNSNNLKNTNNPHTPFNSHTPLNSHTSLKSLSSLKSQFSSIQSTTTNSLDKNTKLSNIIINSIETITTTVFLNEHKIMISEELADKRDIELKNYIHKDNITDEINSNIELLCNDKKLQPSQVFSNIVTKIDQNNINTTITTQYPMRETNIIKSAGANKITTMMNEKLETTIERIKKILESSKLGDEDIKIIISRNDRTNKQVVEIGNPYMLE